MAPPERTPLPLQPWLQPRIGRTSFTTPHAQERSQRRWRWLKTFNRWSGKPFANFSTQSVLIWSSLTIAFLPRPPDESANSLSEDGPFNSVPNYIYCYVSQACVEYVMTNFDLILTPGNWSESIPIHTSALKKDGSPRKSSSTGTIKSPHICQWDTVRISMLLVFCCTILPYSLRIKTIANSTVFSPGLVQKKWSLTLHFEYYYIRVFTECELGCLVGCTLFQRWREWKPVRWMPGEGGPCVQKSTLI